MKHHFCKAFCFGNLRSSAARPGPHFTAQVDAFRPRATADGASRDREKGGKLFPDPVASDPRGLQEPIERYNMVEGHALLNSRRQLAHVNQDPAE